MVPDLSKTAVDSHFHVFAAHQAQPGARYTPAYAAPCGNMAGRRPCRWACGAACWCRPVFMGTDNRLLLSTLAQHPETLRGVAVVAPTARCGHAGATARCGRARHPAEPVRRLASTFLEWSAATALVGRAWLALGWHLELHTDIGQSARRAGATARRAAAGDRPPGQARCGGSGRRQRARARRERARQTPVHMKLSGAYRLGGLDAGALARLVAG
jgi:predicted TIM-barrel fold metal-dependent hydrolase